ncbi:MAG: trypsin-like peptidase domain-containing protein [Clostridia bacterium]|nr:trypsin-like peptidase domain-containing protein [Clostridia bacterium]
MLENENKNNQPENQGTNQIGNNYTCEPDKIIQTPVVLRTVINPYDRLNSGGSAPENEGNGKKKKKNKKRSSAGVIALTVCFCIILSSVFGIGGGYLTARYLLEDAKAELENSQPETQIPDNVNISSEGSDKLGYQSVITTANNGQNYDSSASAITNVVNATKEAVVEITTEVMSTSSFIGQYVTEGAGSGVILTSDGYMITNNHVIDGATNITVRLHDGTEYPAVLIGTDAQTDIAVIKVEAAGLTAAVLGDSDKLQVGEPTVVIGNPLGSLGGTVTNGIISALNRTITIDGQDMTVLQTNAAVNPGNSGGGMFNINGELIGIINAKSSGDAVEGLGFAIPINIAKDIADQLINYGYIKGRPQLGISVATIESANDYWTYRSTELAPYITDYGVYIIEWKNGDFQFGDRVIGFNGKTVSAFADIKAELANYAVGDTVIITVSRSNRITEVEVVLTEYVPQATESAE